MVEFRDVVKKYASDGEALGVKDSTVDGIPVPSAEDFATAAQGAKADTAVQPDDLGAAATMSPVEVVTDPDAQAALSGAFARADDRRTATGLWYTAMNARELTTQALSNAAWAFFDQRIVIPFDGTVTAMMCEVTTAGGAGAKIYTALFEETSPVQTDPLRLVAALGTVDADSTGNKEKTGLSIPVTAGQIFRPALKWDGSGTAPTVRAHRGNAPLSTLSVWAISGQHFGQTIQTSAGAGDFTGDLVVPTAAPAVRTALLVVPS